MTYQFENQYELTDDMVLEYTQKVYTKRLLTGCLLFCGGCMGLGIITLLLWLPLLAISFGVFALVGLAAAVSIPFFFLYHRHIPLRKGTAQKTTVRFGDCIYLRDGGNWESFEYSQLTGIRAFRTFFTLDMGKLPPIILSAKGFPGNESSSFWRFMAKVRPDIKIQAVS